MASRPLINGDDPTVLADSQGGHHESVISDPLLRGFCPRTMGVTKPPCHAMLLRTRKRVRTRAKHSPPASRQKREAPTGLMLGHGPAVSCRCRSSIEERKRQCSARLWAAK
jgi:hypothetical protein